MKHHIYFISILILLFSNKFSTVNAQSPVFESIFINKVNSKGTFLSYGKRVHTQESMVLRDIKLNKDLLFDNISFLTAILNDNFFIGSNYKNKNLYVVHLKSLKIDTIPDVVEFKLIDNQQKLLYHTNHSKALSILNFKNGNTIVFPNVKKFSLSQSQKKLITIDDQNAITFHDLLNTSHYKSLLIANTSMVVKNISWDKLSDIAYLLANDKAQFQLFEAGPKQVSPVFKAPLVNPKYSYAVDTNFRQVRILSDRRIALSLVTVNNVEKPLSDVEVWKGDRRQIGDETKFKRSKNNVLGIIDLKKDTIFHSLVAHKDMKIFISAANEKIYAYESLDDYSKYIPDGRIHYMDKDFSNSKQLTNIMGMNGTMYYQAEGLPLLFYLKDKEWYVFNELTNQHKNISKNIPGEFYREHSKFHLHENDLVRQKFIVYKKRWLFIQDLYDIWKYDLTNDTFTRLTNGKEVNKKYFISQSSFESFESPFTGNVYSYRLKDDNLIALEWHSKDHVSEGIDLIDLERGGNIISLVQDQAKYTQIQRSENFFSYIKQKASMPPAIYVYDIKNRKEYKIYESNSWDSLAKKQEVKYVKWRDENGIETGAIVRCPLNIDSNQKYPAIFDIYERKSGQQHEYLSPFENSMVGFNWREYTDRGYFVIEPDIYYEYTKPGLSATGAVTTAIKELSKKFPIDVDKLGLIGHSWGGYETNFIITKTDAFKAAVSGAGIADITNWYLSVNWTSMRPEFWRYTEDETFRMKHKLFDIPEQYLANSPIFQSRSITTPLLIWTGKEDYHVNWHQSVSMYLALKDQGKDVNLLLYPGEGHVLQKTQNQKDASEKVKNWFDYHLKSLKRIDWLDKSDANPKF